MCMERRPMPVRFSVTAFYFHQMLLLHFLLLVFKFAAFSWSFGRVLTASSAQGVRLVVTFTETGGTLRYTTNTVSNCNCNIRPYM